MASSVNHVKHGDLEDQGISSENWPTSSRLDPLAMIHNQQTHATARMIMAMARYIKANKWEGVRGLAAEIEPSVDGTRNLNPSGDFLDPSSNS